MPDKELEELTKRLDAAKARSAELLKEHERLRDLIHEAEASVGEIEREVAAAKVRLAESRQRLGEG